MHGKIKKLFVTSVLVFAVLVTGCEKEEATEFQEISVDELDEEGVSSDETEIPETIFVHVCGKVKAPGVYELPVGSRIYEAIEAAGGTTADAAADSLNQAQLLTDGEQLYVPSKEEVEIQNADGTVSSDGRININKASKEELMTLSGIGEAKADAIIRYREQQGGFKSIEEIMEIEGIKEGVFHKIENQITVS